MRQVFIASRKKTRYTAFMRFGELLIILLIIVILFGRNRISDLMGDLGKGLRSFKKAMNEDETVTPPVPPKDPLV